MKERIGYVYLLYCLVNGKGYVGQTVRVPERRWYYHIKAAFVDNDQRPLYRAMRKYGLKNFTAQVIWTGPESKLNAAEKRYVRQCGTFIDTGWGYNLTTGGDAYKWSRAARRRLSHSIRATFVDGKRAKRMSQRMKAYCVEHPEYATALSVMMTNDWKKPGAVAKRQLSKVSLKLRNEKVAAAFKTKKTKTKHALAVQASYDNDPTRRVRLSASLKAANKRDPSLVERRAASIRGRKRTPAQIKHIVRANVRSWNDEESRARRIAAMRIGAQRRWARKEEHTKHSMAIQAAWNNEETRAKFETAQRKRRRRERKECALNVT